MPGVSRVRVGFVIALLCCLPIVGWAGEPGEGRPISQSIGSVKTFRVQVAATDNVNIANPGTTVFDSVSLPNPSGVTASYPDGTNQGDRYILLWMQTNPVQNGIYLFKGSGTAMARVYDFKENADVRPGTQVRVLQGAEHARALFVLTNTSFPIVDTTALTFVKDDQGQGSPIEIAGDTCLLNFPNALRDQLCTVAIPDTTDYALFACLQPENAGDAATCDEENEWRHFASLNSTGVFNPNEYDRGNRAFINLSTLPLRMCATDNSGACVEFFEADGVIGNRCVNVDGSPCSIRTLVESGRSYCLGARLDNTPINLYCLNNLNGTDISWTFEDVGKWRKSIFLPADGLYMQGCTLTTDAAMVTGGLISPFIVCGDNNAHGFHREIEMPDGWDGGVFTIMLTVINVNATPANNYEIDFSAECKRQGEALGTTISTTGEQPALINFNDGGSCEAAEGNACDQFDKVSVTTANITPNGTCTGTGRLLRLQGQIDASNTTTTQVSEIKIVGIKIEYLLSSPSD